MYQLISTKKCQENIGNKIKLRGWVENVRSSGKITFLQFRDGYGDIQVVCSADRMRDTYNNAKSITPESSCIIYGVVAATFKVSGGIEVISDFIEIVSLCQDYPLGDKEHGVEFLFENRHLAIRNPKESALLKIRSNLGLACRLFLHEQGFYEFASPIITPSACEGRSR